jgi:uncharacterized membrane protein YfbV (UPF0208 family)
VAVVQVAVAVIWDSQPGLAAAVVVMVVAMVVVVAPLVVKGAVVITPAPPDTATMVLYVSFGITPAMVPELSLPHSQQIYKI